MYLYSSSANGFYISGFNDENMPDDAVEVSEVIFTEYSGTPPRGKIRAASDGGPVWIDIPPASYDDLVFAADQKKNELLGNARLTISEWQSELQLGIINDADKASLITWLAYIKSVQAVDTSVAPDINWPVAPEV